MTQYLHTITFSIFAFAILSTITGNGQPSPNSHESRLYKDSLNRIYTKQSEPAYIFLGNSKDPDNAIRLKSKSTEEHANPMHFDGNGMHYIRHKDLQEHVEVKFEVWADDNAPQSKADIINTSTAYRDGKLYAGKDGRIKLTSKDNLSGVREKYHVLNDTVYQKAGSMPSITKEGTYKYHFYAVDNVGNVESPHTLTFEVDKTAPKSNHKVLGNKNKTVLSGNSRIQINSSDKAAGIKTLYYRLDDGKKRLYRRPISTTVLKEGEHTIYYHATDKVGNKEKTKEFTFYVDKSGPMISKEIIGDRYVSNGKAYSSGRTKVKIMAMDNKAGVGKIYYRINKKKFQEYTEPFTLPNVQGDLNIEFYAVDKVGNKNFSQGKQNNNIQNSYVDMTGPSIERRFHGPTFINQDTLYINEKTKISLSARDNRSGLKVLKYQVDNKASQTYKEPFRIKEEGVHSINITGKDKVNNTNQENITFMVDTTGPTIYHRFGTPAVAANDSANDLSSDSTYPKHTALFLSATDKGVGYKAIYYKINNGSYQRYRGDIEGFRENQKYSVKIKAIDHLGNETYKTVNFKVSSKN